MQLHMKQTVELLDGRSRRLGSVTVEQIEDDFVLGRFAPAPEFAAVEPIFSEFVAAANDQLFDRVDELDSAIVALDLRLDMLNGVRLPAIRDVQIAGENI